MSSNPFALSNIQQAVDEQAAPKTDNPFAIQNVQRQQQDETRGVLKAAVSVNPDHAAEVSRLAKLYPAPEDVLLRNLQDVQLQAAVDKADERLRTSPKLAEHMRNNPFVAKMAHDDIEPLAKIGQFMSDLGGSMKAGVFRASRGAAGTFQAGLEFIAPALDVFEADDPLNSTPGMRFFAPLPGGNPLRRLAEGFAMQGQAAGETARAARPKTEGIVVGGFFSGIESLTQNLITLPAAFLPGGQGVALSGMTAFTGGDAYQQAREKGLPMSQALPFAASQASIEYATEKLPLGHLLKDVKAGAGFLRILGRQIALEVPGEQIATVLQDLNEWAILNPEKPFSSYIEERPSAAAQTLIATIVGTGGNVAVAKGLETMISRAARDGANMQRAGITAQALEQALKVAETSKLRERAPEQFRALMTEMAEDGSIYVDAEVLNQMPSELLQQMEGVVDALPEALLANASVAVKLADVLTLTPGTPQAEVFMQNARSAPDAMSQVEAEEAGKQAQTFLQQESARVIAQAQDQEVARQSRETVKQSILGELNAAGRQRPAVNDIKAGLAADYFTVMGSKMGMTAEQFYAKHRLRVLGAPSATAPAGEEIEQSVTRDLVITHNLSGENLLHAQRMGGVAVPSLAVTKGNAPLDGFGEITLIGGPEMADPKGYAGTKVFGADIYSPRYPSVEFKFDNKAQRALNEALAPFRQENDRELYGSEIRRADDLASYKPFKRWAADRYGVEENALGWSQLATSANALVRQVGAGERIFQGFTYSGNRKYVDHTLDNVVKILKKELRGGESFNYGVGSLRAKFTPQFKSIAQIRKEKGRLVTREAFDAIKKEIDGEFVAIAESLGLSLDQTIEVFEDAPKLGAKRAIERARKDYARDDSEADPDKVRDVAEFLTKLRNLPTQYFEAKILRAVDVAEFAAAVVPSDASPEVLAALAERGVKRVATYDRNVEGDRAAKIQEFNDLFFQGQPQGPRGTFNPRTLELVLNPNSDLTTFFHELGHFFLEVQADIASQPDAPAMIVEDMNKILAWFGVPDLATWNGYTLDQKRPYHERLAESFEQYLMEGKAPSVELQPVFRRIRSWFLRAYKSIQNFLAMRGQAPAGGETLGQAPAPADALKGEDGQPLKLYHGTQRSAGSITKFVPSKSGAVFFAENPEYASGWASIRIQQEDGTAFPEQAQVVPAYLTASNLYDANADPLGLVGTPETDFYKKGVVSKLRKAGYDGAVWGNPGDRVFVSFDPKQIVSAISGEVLGQNGQPQPLNLQLNDDIRRVFDRMLATDEQIQQANEVAGLMPDEQADGEAAERLQKRSLADLKWAVKARDKVLAKLRKEAKAIEKATREEVTAEVDATPEMQAKVALDKLRKDKALTDEAMGAVADSFEFTSVDHMLKAINAFGNRNEVIDGMTEQRMLEEHGDLIDERAIQEAANEAVHNEARARSLATELRTQQEMLNARTETGQTNARGARITVNTLLAAAKQFGANVVARTPLRDIKSTAWKHTSAERRAAKRWQEATAAGKTQDAVKAKQDQVLNNAAARAALEAQNEAEKILNYLKKFDKDSVRAKLPHEYLDQIDKLLERVDLRVSTTGRQIDRRASLSLWIQTQQDMGMDPVVPDYLLEDAKLISYKEMTLDELVGLSDAVKNIEHLGRLKSKLLAAKDKREFDAIVDEWAAEIRANGGKPKPVKLEPDNRVVRFFKGAWADHRKLNSLIRQMDGGKYGPGFNAIVASMNERGTQEDVALEKATMALAEIMAPMDKLPGGLSGDKRFIAAINNSLSRAGRLAIALNWGNEQNRQRVRDGDGWTDAQVNAILSTLSVEELQFVNRVWEHLDSYWPEIKAKQERVSGVVEEKVEAEPFTITAADGTVVPMRGGYYPIKYDPDRSIRAQINDAKQVASDMLRGAMLKPTTRRGHTKARVDEVKGRPIRKDLAPITQHVAQVVHDLAWHEWAIDTNRLLADPRIASAIRDHHGAEIHRAMTDAVEAIVVGDVAKQTEIDKLLLAMRANVTRSIMGVSATTALLQPFGLTQSMARIGVVPVLKGAARWAGDAAKMESTVKWVHGKSDFMRLRGKTFNRELREINSKIQGKWKVTQVMDAVLFFPMQKMQMVADIPTWVGMYEKALNEGADEARAIAMADEAVLSAQGGGGTKDLAAVQRSLPFLTQFYSYFSTTLQLVAEKTALTDWKNPRAVGGWIGDMALLAIIPAILPALITHLLKGGGDDDDPEKWAKKFAEWQASYLLGMFVGLRELPALWSPFDYAGPPAGKLVNDGKRLVQQAEQGEIDDPAVLATIGFLGTALGIPTTQIIRSYKGWKAWDEGNAPPSSILFGPPPPKN